MFPSKARFQSIRIKQFFFDSVSFKEPIYLPKETEELTLGECESPNLIKAQKVSRIDFSYHKGDPKEYEELIKTLKGVKVVTISDSLKKCLTSLPSTIRKIEGFWNDEDKLEGMISQFPYLIEVSGGFPIQPTDNNKIRAIQPILQKTQEKFNLRPRKIIVDRFNVIQLNTHPELFEKVEWICIHSDEFNLDVLPSEIKKIKIYNEVNEER